MASDANAGGQPCCDMMAHQLGHVCDIHPDPFDCPDVVVAPVNGGFGLIIHDGGQSVLGISFCPWCGARLPGIRS